MSTILLFAGTSEGRLLTKTIAESGKRVLVCVATDYGEALLHESESLETRTNLTVRTGRMNRSQIEELILSGDYSCAVDATHPFAVEVTDNLTAACKKTALPYYRLLRPAEDLQSCVQAVDSAAEAARFLAKTEGEVLLTTGSKEIWAFTEIPNYRERLFPRILPSTQAISHCTQLGFPAKNLICMQGPFTKELNLAIFHQYHIKWLVTKDSGAAGGVPEKLEAAREAGVGVILIGRPAEEAGYGMEELLKKLGISVKPRPAPQTSTSDYFPLFVSLSGQEVQVFGGGNIALRRVRALLPFGCKVEVIAPQICQELKELGRAKKIKCLEAARKPGDCSGKLVLAATDNRKVNHGIAAECRQKGIAVNVADSQEDCDFFFPALIMADGLVAGICSGGKDHAKVKRTAAVLREALMGGEECKRINNIKEGR